MPAGAFAQKINGHVYDFSSIVVNIGPTVITQFSAINWSYSLEPGKLRGASAHKLGRTRGQFDASGKLTIAEAEWAILRSALMLIPLPPGGGYMQKSFDINVSMADLPAPPSIVMLKGCRITNVDMNAQQGSDFLSRELTIDIMKVLEDGAYPVVDRSGILPV